ncbi:hypothetical protein SDJN02_08304, partial [Cucurbita argyrosperma subsp. argyrosperma]
MTSKSSIGSNKKTRALMPFTSTTSGSSCYFDCATYIGHGCHHLWVVWCILTLPNEATIHPLFHMSQLKEAVGDPSLIQPCTPMLTMLIDEFEWTVEPQEVQELTCKSKNLEAELEKTSKKLMEVTAIATDEADKCKSAKEVIKSLATQNMLKEMADKMPEAHSDILNYCTVSGQNGSNLNQLPTESLSMSINSRLESNGISKSQNLPTGNKGQNEKGEWVVQDEPGVRRHFTEAQAEKWWAEFGAKVCERHKGKKEGKEKALFGDRLPLPSLEDILPFSCSK